MQHLPIRRAAGTAGLLFGLVGLAGLVALGGCNALTGVGDLEVSGAGGGRSSASGVAGSGQVGGGSTHPGVGGSNPGVGGAGPTTGASSVTGAGAGSSASVTSTGASTAASAGSSTSAASTGSGTNNTAEQLCVDTINMLRATRSLPAYTRWSANESCVDGEAQTDKMQMTPHYAFGHGMSCSANAQNECPNWPMDPTSQGGVAACLQQMWNEKNQAACAGCDTCDFPYDNCTNCEFNGPDAVCGHYLNMKSSVLSTVACGFSGGWYAMDFR